MHKNNSIPYNFAALSLEYSDYKSARAVILPVPYDHTVSYIAGAKNGPRAIISASRNMELYDDEISKNIYESGIHTADELMTVIDPEKMNSIVYSSAKEFLDDGKFIVALGGDHSISYGIIKAASEKFKNLSVLQLDAHADLRDSYEGTKFSHACIMRRVSEICKFTQVGIRSYSEEEAEFIAEKKLKLFLARELNGEKWMDEVVKGLSENVYITIDVDVFDPSIMPSTGTPEPGGLDWHTALKLLKKVFEKKKVVGFDVVELSPMQNVAPDFMLAKLVYKLIGYKFL